MSEKTFIEAYKAEINRKIIDMQITLGRGAAKSYEDYKKKTGRIEGYEDALRIFSELIKKYIDESEIDD